MFINGLDDPDNDPAIIKARIQQKTDRTRIEKLKVKIRNDTISQRELVEYIRLTL